MQVILLDSLTTWGIGRASRDQFLATVQRGLVVKSKTIAVNALILITLAGDAFVVGLAKLLLVASDTVDLDAPTTRVKVPFLKTQSASLFNLLEMGSATGTTDSVNSIVITGEGDLECLSHSLAGQGGKCNSSNRLHGVLVLLFRAVYV